MELLLMVARVQKRKRISFIMPFIDFAFMVIIIFLGMLSIAVFEAPGEAPRVIPVEPIEPIAQKEAIKKEVSAGKEVLKKKRAPLAKEQKLKEEIKELKALLRQKKRKTQPLTPSQETGFTLKEWHAYTDLRKKESERKR